MSEEKIIGNVVNVIETPNEIIVRVVFHKGRDKIDDVMYSFKKDGSIDYTNILEEVKKKMEERAKEIKSRKKGGIDLLMELKEMF
jgi:hypothetical protein